MKKILVILLLLVTLVCIADTQSDDSWYMYPNPARDHITLKALQGVLDPWVRIYDMRGVRVFEKYIGRELTYAVIEFNLRPGTYIVMLEKK